MAKGILWANLPKQLLTPLVSKEPLRPFTTQVQLKSILKTDNWSVRSSSIAQLLGIYISELSVSVCVWGRWSWIGLSLWGYHSFFSFPDVTITALFCSPSSPILSRFLLCRLHGRVFFPLTVRRYLKDRITMATISHIVIAHTCIWWLFLFFEGFSVHPYLTGKSPSNLFCPTRNNVAICWLPVFRHGQMTLKNDASTSPISFQDDSWRAITCQLGPSTPASLWGSSL